MSITSKLKERLMSAVRSREETDELVSVLESSSSLEPAASVAPIATPATADAEEVALKVNEVIQALKDAGLME